LVPRMLVAMSLLSLTGMLAAGCASKSTSGSSGSGGLSGAALKAKVGQKVTWTDAQMGIKHTVTASGGAFNHVVVD
jgi:plastocyanin